ncbi:MAG: DUF3782 domain-containing protein [Magnetococcales bacterium]|nr:DUF3782 domain-containing protein [Magnetococcales bacterium]MBF0116888.1 DUF3782 domain-containing protein [Magnetococcales bacterium]
MSSALTVNDVWKMFEETNRLLQESQAEWKQQRQEMERVRQEDRAETERVIREERAKTEMAFRETERQMQETDRKIKQVSTQIGQLGGRWGEFVEGLIAPACIAMFTERGIQVDELYPRVKKVIGGKTLEIDLLVANTVAAVLVEVKSQLQVEDVRNHLTRLADFKSFFPRYANCQVYGAVAGIVVESQADQFAMKQGLFVIEQSGETVRLANDMEFKPKVW